MTEPEFIPFTVDEDDLLPHKRRKQTKDDAIYGIFNEHQSDEEHYDKPMKYVESHGIDQNAREERTEAQTSKLPKNFEKMYGKGYKLLQMSGFQTDKGLGKNLQGRIEPVEVTRRSKKQGLSFAKPENVPLKAKTQPEVPSWLKPKSEMIRPKRSIQEVREDLQDIICTQPGVLASLIDMRSGTPIEVVDFSKLNDPTHPRQAIEAAAQELVVLERGIQTDKDTMLALEYEESQLITSIAKSEEILRAQAAALEFLENVSAIELDAFELLQVLQSFEFNWPIFAEDFELKGKYGLTLGSEAFKQVWVNWRFEEEPLRGHRVVKLWTEWLGEISAGMMEPWQVQVVIFVNVRWSPKRETGELIDNLTLWRDVLPTQVWETVSSSLLHRLGKELEAWDPQIHGPPHTWLHPWLSLLDLSELWSIFVSKLSRVLSKWNPEDLSAHAFLKPWKGVLGTHWLSMLKRHILPKLVQVMHEVPLDHVDCMKLDWVLAWLDMFPTDVLINALLTEFYPRWYAFLKSLLTQSDFDMDSAERWFVAWQERLPILDFSKVFSDLGL